MTGIVIIIIHFAFVTQSTQLITHPNIPFENLFHLVWKILNVNDSPYKNLLTIKIKIGNQWA